MSLVTIDSIVVSPFGCSEEIMYSHHQIMPGAKMKILDLVYLQNLNGEINDQMAQTVLRTNFRLPPPFPHNHRHHTDNHRINIIIIGINDIIIIDINNILIIDIIVIIIVSGQSSSFSVWCSWQFCSKNQNGTKRETNL